MKSRNSYINKELIELKHLTHRPEHLDKVLPKKVHAANELRMLSLMAAYSKKHHVTNQLHPIFWKPTFKQLGSAVVMTNDTSRTASSQQFNLYLHKTKQPQTTYHISCHSYFIDNKPVTTIDATASISMTIMKEYAYPENKKGYLRITYINNKNQPFRLGSVLIQAAIELSYQKGLEGRICLQSGFKSGLFYFKLGFTPRNLTTYKKLAKKEKINGGSMYLSQKAIQIWQDKISQQHTIPMIKQ